MKSIRILIAAITVAVAGVVAQPAAAQFRFGPKVGLNVNKLHLSKDMGGSENRAGFNAGVMVEFTAPIIGIGVDLSAMYVRRSAQWAEQQQIDRREYIEIPLNLKYKLNIPVVNSLVRPFLTTGPSFSFLTSKKSFEAFRNKSCDVAWNFGFGVEVLKHVQVAASYGIGMTKAFQYVGVIDGGAGIEGKNRYWTVTAAYLF